MATSATRKCLKSWPAAFKMILRTKLEAFDFARQIAELSPCNYRHGCVITDRAGRLVSFGFNSNKTHPTQARYASSLKQEHKIFLHAEIAALVKARHLGYNLYVVRVDRSGRLKPSEPCPICMMAISKAGIVNIVHS